MIVFLDSETSDLLKRDVSLGDPSQPWICALACQLDSMDGTPRDFFSTRIRSDGRSIRLGAQNVHGISSKEAGRNGVSEIAALGLLVGFAAQARYCVGYNVAFDRDVIVATLARLGKDDRMLVRPGLELVDVMLASAPVCRLPSGRDDGQFKWPSLDDCAEIILGEPRRSGPHSAWEDLQITRRVFYSLRERDVIEVAA